MKYSEARELVEAAIDEMAKKPTGKREKSALDYFMHDKPPRRLHEPPNPVTDLRPWWSKSKSERGDLHSHNRWKSRGP